MVTQDENNNHNLNKGEVEEDQEGSDNEDNEDNDEGTRTYWWVKAKEGHKVSVCFAFMFVLLTFLYSAQKKKVTPLATFAFFHEGCSHCNSQIVLQGPVPESFRNQGPRTRTAKNGSKPVVTDSVINTLK